MAKNKKSKQQEKLSPKQYIQQKIRTLDIGDCYMTPIEEIEGHGRGIAIVSRRHKSGNVSIATYLLDTFCMGVTDTTYRLQMTNAEYEELVDDYALPTYSYNEVHNMIYGAVEFASEAGINPCADFALTKFFLEKDDDKIPIIEYDYGQNGKHHLFTDNVMVYNRYLPLLEKNLGAGNFYYTFITDKDFENDGDDDDENYTYSPRYTDYSKHHRVDYSYKHPEYPSSMDIRLPLVKELVADNPDLLTDEQIDQLLALPNDDLRHDLCEVITNSLYRYADFDADDFGKEDHFSCDTTINAIMLLGETGYSEQSVNVILEMMRQNEAFYNNVFGDAADYATTPTLAKLVNGREQMLVDFIKEPGLCDFFKGDAVTTLCQLSLYNPERRAEFVEILRDLLVFATEKIPQPNPYFDIWLTGHLLFMVSDLKSVELLPEIEALFATGEADKNAIGDFEEVKRDLNSSEENNKDVYPLDIKARYAELRTWENT